jgi:hypothetical protein
MGILDAMGEEEDEEGCVEIWRAGLHARPGEYPESEFSDFLLRGLRWKPGWQPRTDSSLTFGRASDLAHTYSEYIARIGT